MGNLSNFDKESTLSILADQHRQVWKGGEDVPGGTKLSTMVFENRLSFTISEVAYSLGVSQKSVERLVKRGEIKSKRVGRRVLIPRSDIEAWLNQKE